MNAAHIRMSDNAHILVVDDDREIRTLLRDYLEKNGFKATAVADGQETRRALERARFDLIVLDLMLPHESGLEICRELRTRSDIPIVMLTALGEEVDRIVGLEVGADDYLAKPFSPRELLGRIRAVLRRTLAPRLLEPNDVRAYTFAGWNLDTTARALTTPKGETVSLGGAEFRRDAPRLARNHGDRAAERQYEQTRLIHGAAPGPKSRLLWLCSGQALARLWFGRDFAWLVVRQPADRDDHQQGETRHREEADLQRV